MPCKLSVRDLQNGCCGIGNSKVVLLAVEQVLVMSAANVQVQAVGYKEAELPPPSPLEPSTRLAPRIIEVPVMKGRLAGSVGAQQ